MSVTVLAQKAKTADHWLIIPINPLTPEDFYVFEWFSAYTRPIGFRDSIFTVTMESAAVLKH